MRVTRRTRPSQIGFAASIGRRRLLQTFDTHPATSKNDQLSTTGLRLVIRLDFSPSDSAVVAELERPDAEAIPLQPAVAASSNARGR